MFPLFGVSGGYIISCKRRKKLHGSSCKVVKSILYTIAEDAEVSISALEANLNAYLCHNCSLLLCNVKKAQEKLNGFVATVRKHLLDHSALPVTTSSAEMLPPAAKRPCLAEPSGSSRSGLASSSHSQAQSPGVQVHNS